jgi:hypothetical protein
MPAIHKEARVKKHIGTWVLLLILASSCTALPGVQSPIFPASFGPIPLTLTPFQPIAWTPTPVFTPTPTPPPYSLWIHPSIPESFVKQIEIPAEFGRSSQPQNATLRLEPGGNQPVSQWVYTLVAPFPTVTDGVSAEDLLAAWKGESRGDFGGIPLMMTESTLGMLTTLWGDPSTGSVKVIPPDELVHTSWDARPSWAIIPFEELNPRWKVLTIDGISPIHKDFNLQDYELTIPISMVGVAPVQPQIPAGNRDPGKLTMVVMTGVTALVRATAFTMETHGITYPARDIGGWLQEADITHISNEVPFAEDCPYPNPVQEGMRFCSDERYIELLEYVGTDVVELTGDHFSDWGPEALLYTLDLYDERGWPYYGGGANYDSGKQAVTFTHNGNRIAFIGCNAKGGGYARASDSTPGAVACDFSWMQSEIRRLTEDGYLVIGTFQHFEYYTYAAQPDQIRDAGLLTEAGAVIVSGSQAHQPQAFEFSNGGLVHHGLGNLFFDQLDVSNSTRQGFIDQHVFYDGRYISTELLTIYFIDYARARPMTPAERLDLLTAVFRASGW